MATLTEKILGKTNTAEDRAKGKNAFTRALDEATTYTTNLMRGDSFGKTIGVKGGRKSRKSRKSRRSRKSRKSRKSRRSRK
jgi:hypothetical protein